MSVLHLIAVMVLSVILSWLLLSILIDSASALRDIWRSIR
jgi:hypothetical protein